MDEARSRRVFFALWPDTEAAAHLSALAHSLVPGSGRPIRPPALHLTLAFIGAVTPTQVLELDEIAATVCADAFELSLDRLGFWPQRGILWAGCRQPPAVLQALAETLATKLRAAGFDIPPHPGSARVPHVTLARRARCASLPRLETPVRWHAGEFALVESLLHPSAASYTTLARFALRDAAANEA